MIFAVGFKWYRPFRDHTQLEIAPITLLYGQNAAGKSSILKALLFLKQNLLSSSEVGEFTFTADLVDLGSARAMAHLHHTYEPTVISLSLLLKMPERLGGSDSKGGCLEIEFRLPHDEIDTQVRYKFLDLPGEPTLTWDLTTVDNSRRVFILNHESLPTYRELFGSVVTNAEGDDPTGGIDIYTRPVMRCVGMLPANQIGTFSGNFREFPRFRNADEAGTSGGADTIDWSWESFAAGKLRSLIRNEMNRVNHVGPARRMPARVEPHSLTAPGLLVALRQDETLRVRLNRQLSSLGVGYEVVSRRVDDSVLGEIHVLELRNIRSGVTTALTDVGYGISQILPVVLESNRPGNNLLLIEQPELHLHPRLQAELGDMFISGARGGTNTTFLVETHSEAIILRLLRRIREKRLPLSAVKVYYVDQDDDGVAGIKELRINEDGEFITTWPHGFFDERLRETIDNFTSLEEWLADPDADTEEF